VPAAYPRLADELDAALEAKPPPVGPDELHRQGVREAPLRAQPARQRAEPQPPRGHPASGRCKPIKRSAGAVGDHDRIDALSP
jgi:hypothetical protein